MVDGFDRIYFYFFGPILYCGLMLLKVEANRGFADIEQGLLRFVNYMKHAGKGNWADMVHVGRVFYVSASYPGENRIQNRVWANRIKKRLKNYDQHVKVDRLKDSQWEQIQKYFQKLKN